MLHASFLRLILLARHCFCASSVCWDTNSNTYVWGILSKPCWARPVYLKSAWQPKKYTNIEDMIPEKGEGTPAIHKKLRIGRGEGKIILTVLN